MRLALAAALLVAVSLAAQAKDLDTILAARPEADRTRDIYRRPSETLAFFGLEPGMTVVEALPGRGWYSKILVPYIGAEGRFYGWNYSNALYRKVMGERWDARRERIEGWQERFPAEAAAYSDTPPKVGAFHIGQAPAALMGQVDLILFIRALHHLNRFDPTLLDAAAAETYALLKPGGVAGIVQHRAPEVASDTWAGGNNGYLKQSRVIEAFAGAGFTLAARSEINANPKDQPTEKDRVWRLPPSLSGGDDNRDTFIAIGESDRMTLKFIKPR